MTTRTRIEVERDIARRKTTLDRARAEKTEAAKAVLEAENSFKSTRKQSSFDKKVDAQKTLRLHEELEGFAVEELETVQRELAQIEREEVEARYAAIKGEIAAFADTLAEHAASFIAIDRSVHDRVLAIAVDVERATEKRKQAEALASELRMQPDFARLPRVDMKSCQLAIQRAVSDARKHEGRWLRDQDGNILGGVAPIWLGDAPDSWNPIHKGQNAEEIASSQQAMTNARAEEAQIATYLKGVADVVTAKPLAPAKTNNGAPS